jgi:hypothetical protein
MGLYNFQKRFVAAILAGKKKHTIRALREYPDKPGDTLHLYTGLRTKKAKLLMRVTCVKVDDIEIRDYSPTSNGEVLINGVVLSQDEREALAVRDGFNPMTIGRGAGQLTAWANMLEF